MSLSHHGDREQSENMRRMLDQINGTARRQYPEGRMGAEDDGVLSYLIAADPVHRTIAIRFGKPVEWIGLGIEDARALRDKLDEKLLELHGVKDG